MLRYHFHSSLPAEPTLASLLALLATIFDNKSVAEHLAELRYQQARAPLHCWLATDDEDRVVGCKLGYDRKPGHYYSWLGGVLPAHRGQGIAAELMRQQHAWCQAQGYERIRTQTYNQWRQMLILNLRFGFDVVGSVQGEHGLTLVLERPL